MGWAGEKLGIKLKLSLSWGLGLAELGKKTELTQEDQNLKNTIDHGMSLVFHKVVRKLVPPLCFPT